MCCLTYLYIILVRMCRQNIIQHTQISTKADELAFTCVVAYPVGESGRTNTGEGDAVLFAHGSSLVAWVNDTSSYS